ncbi:hypothetical protein HUN43_00030 [Streptomyces phage Endor1]|uniref:Uncharacterized protein n=1 Tax=Streptomyces phage Endor1 TaxID=2740181 RepID=A0A7G4AX02_9CAUD|nr:hypothetical protein KGG92_gp30 [Streptomyces phage Endor1]QMP84542.1 hypothetical protein HUN43_00030 [Streptomyces phage Endor1]
MPHRQHLPAWNDELGDPRSFTTRDGCIHFSSDMEGFDFHIDASPGYEPEVMTHVLSWLQGWGLELMDEDECEPELLEHGITRIYLTPIVPPEVAEAEMVRELLVEVDALTVTPLNPTTLEVVPLGPELHGDPEPDAPEPLGTA